MSMPTLREVVGYEEAMKYATEVLEFLRPDCERIEIAGSLRRKRKRIGDIEIVAIPKPYEGEGLFATGIAATVSRWEKVKGTLPCKHTQRILPCGMKLDLFFATPETWGHVLAIRTGPSEFSHKELARRWCRMGYESIDNYLYKRGQSGIPGISFREEADLFFFLGIKFVKPEDRG